MVGLGSSMFDGIRAAFLFIVIIIFGLGCGIGVGLHYYMCADVIKSKELLTPDAIELIIKDNKLDTLYIYELP